MSLPLIRLDALGPRGLEVTPGAWADPCAAEGAGGPVADLTGNIRLERYDRSIFASGTLSGVATVPCARCLTPLTLPISGTFACLYTPLSEIPERGEDDEGDPEVPADLAGRVDEFGEYDGIALDLGSVVREFFALEAPPQPRCGDIAQPHLADQEDAACLARWRARVGPPASVPTDDVVASPFAALASLKIRK